ncbi:MAG: hypothetical protein KC592_15950 [Nitrospira sp.]|nr:hypothetical protein [Nitrospira sp.]MCW5783318.1 hypothetical protein [Nitrospirales bacterium]
MLQRRLLEDLQLLDRQRYHLLGNGRWRAAEGLCRVDDGLLELLRRDPVQEFLQQLLGEPPGGLQTKIGRERHFPRTTSRSGGRITWI